jgi:hypothetical protein
MIRVKAWADGIDLARFDTPLNMNYDSISHDLTI